MSSGWRREGGRSDHQVIFPFTPQKREYKNRMDRGDFFSNMLASALFLVFQKSFPLDGYRSKKISESYSHKGFLTAFFHQTSSSGYMKGAVELYKKCKHIHCDIKRKKLWMHYWGRGLSSVEKEE